METSVHSSITAPTRREVFSNWQCFNHTVLDGADGSLSNVTYKTGDANTTAKIYIGGDPSPGATVYVTESEVFCGIRCAIVWGFQSFTPESRLQQAYLYRCEISISNVSNITDPRHILSDEVARIAAGSIGLDGYDRNTQPATQISRFRPL